MNLMIKGGLRPKGIARKPLKLAPKPLKRPKVKRRRRKGEITKLKDKLWQLCRSLKPSTTCYTCGRQNLTGSNRQLGHYIASSLCSVELRFDLKNLEICCYNCNINKSGNTLQFQKNLIRDHGADYVEELWTRNEETKGTQYPQSWFENKIQTYTELLATLTI